jgi:hypothetical protein
MSILTSFDQFKSNFKQVNELKQLLTNDNLFFTLIVGSASTGKTSIKNIIKSSYPYEILYINDTTYNLTETIKNFTECITIDSMFFKNKKKKLIYIDDIDTLLLDKDNIVSLLKVIKKTINIICTVQTVNENKLANLKKTFTNTIYLNRVSFKDCLVIMDDYIEENNMNNIDYDKLIELIKEHDGNIKNIIMFLNDVDKESNFYELSVIKNECEALFNKNLYKIVDKIFNEKLSEDELNSLQSHDPSIIITVIHENLINFNIKRDYIKNIIKMYDLICHNDMINHFTYTNRSEIIMEHITNYICFKKINDYFVDIKMLKKDIKFTQQFTKLSSQISHKKKLYTFDNKFISTYYLDIMNYIINMIIHDKKIIISDKNIIEMIQRVCKDFNITSLTSSSIKKNCKIL